MRRLITSPRIDQNLQLEAITALGQLRDSSATDLLIDLVSAPWPSARAAALARPLETGPVDIVHRRSISGARSRMFIGRCGRHWRRDARRPAARTLAGAADGATERQRSARAGARASTRWRRLARPMRPPEFMARLKSDDPVVRGAAARGLATHQGCPRPPPALIEAVQDRAGRRALRGADRGARRADRARSGRGEDRCWRRR